MQINVTKLTDLRLMQWACSMTIDAESHVSLNDMYKCEHSPMRTQIFKVEMLGIPAFVSVHFVRHTQGVTHFCKSLRDDRCGIGTEDRNTPTNHGMILNAQALINMARKRLCYKSHFKTKDVMKRIKFQVSKIDPDLARYMVSECMYRGICPEKKPCKHMYKMGVR